MEWKFRPHFKKPSKNTKKIRWSIDFKPADSWWYLPGYFYFFWIENQRIRETFEKKWVCINAELLQLRSKSSQTVKSLNEPIVTNLANQNELKLRVFSFPFIPVISTTLIYLLWDLLMAQWFLQCFPGQRINYSDVLQLLAISHETAGFLY